NREKERQRGIKLVEQGACVCVCVCVGKKHLESAVLHCLCLLDLALQKQALFMDLLRESQASLLVSPLEQLLQGVSAHTRKADHITSIARYTTSHTHTHHTHTHTH